MNSRVLDYLKVAVRQFSNARRSGRRSSAISQQAEAVEFRILLARNLQLTAATLVDASNVVQANPVYGQNTYVRANWTSQDLTGSESAITVRYTANFPANYFYVGSPVTSYPADSGAVAMGSGNGSWFWYRGGWYSGTSVYTITVMVDPDNLIPESDESDNSTTITVTPIAPTTLASKFIQPITKTANDDWAINNYADIDPRTGSAADYRLGPYQYDGHDAIDAGPWGFDVQDQGLPLVAAADGVIIDIDGGTNFDRETSINNRPWNAVYVDHGNGWVTQYGHIAANTITVKIGDAVKAGDVIGLMGSSGNSTGSHIHYTAFYRGCQVEAGFAPNSYWVNPLPYGGDVSPFAFASGISNYDPGSDIGESPVAVTSVPSSTNGTDILYFWMQTYGLSNNDVLTWKYYRPNGTLAFSNTFTLTADYRFSWWYWSRTLSSFQGAVGTWQVGYEVNSVEISRSSFTVATQGAASMRVSDASNNILIDQRATPVDFGSVTSGGSTAQQVLTIRNQGYRTLNLSNFQLPRGFSFAVAPPATVAAGSSVTLTIRLDAADTGRKFGTLRFDTNDPDVPQFDLALTGNVTGAAPVGSPSIVLGGSHAIANYLDTLPSLLAPLATVTDTNSTNFATGTLTAEFASFGEATDRLAIRNQGTSTGQIGINASDVSFAGTLIGSFVGGNGLVPLVINLNSNATVAAVQALIRNLTYHTTSTTPTTQRKGVLLTLNDGTGLSNTPVVQHVVNTGVISTNAKPSITTGSTQSINENSTAVVSISAMDGDGETLVYSITGGADQALFSINPGTGALTFNSAPNFEAPADAGGDNIYDLVVGVSDGVHLVVTQAMVVTVANVNEAPAFTSSSSISLQENTTTVVTLTSSDPDAGATQAYSLGGGVDLARFSIDSASGVLSFISPPDFEIPADSDLNNVYQVTVRVSDGTNLVSQNLTVTITDVSDNLLPGLVIVHSNGSTIVNESGSTDTVSVRLTVQPTANVSVNVVSQDTTEFSVQPATLQFSATNWSIAQVLTVTGVDDASTDGTILSTLRLTVDNSSAPEFRGVISSVPVSTVDNELATPVVSAPATVTSSPRPVVTWSAVSGATSYRVIIVNRSNGGTEVVNTLVTTNRYQAATAFSIGEYAVRVQAFSTNGRSSAVSAEYRFRVDTPPVLVPLPSLLRIATPTFSWNTVPGAVKYDLRVDSVLDIRPGVIRQTNMTSTTFVSTASLPLGLYEARVRAIDKNGVASRWSAVVSFTVAIAPVLLTPGTPTFNPRPAFTWQRVPGAVVYDLKYQRLSNGQITEVKNLSTTTFTPPADLSNGGYRWWVRAHGSYEVTSFWSAPKDFSIGGVPQLRPITSPTGPNPMFEWTKVDRAARYILRIDRIDRPQTFVVREELTSNSYTVPGLPAGTYRVWVKAVSASGVQSNWSVAVDFRVANVIDPIPSSAIDLAFASFPVRFEERSGMSESTVVYEPERWEEDEEEANHA